MKVVTIILGVITLLAGIFCLAHPAFTAFSIAWLLGLLLIASGISIIANYFSKKEGSGWDIFFSILSIIGGGLLMCNYFSALFADTIIVYFIAGMVAFMGISRIASSLQMKKGGAPWVWTLISGIISLLVSLFTFVNPMFGILFIDYKFAVIFIIQGINLILFGAMFKPFGKKDK